MRLFFTLTLLVCFSAVAGAITVFGPTAVTWCGYSVYSDPHCIASGAGAGGSSYVAEGWGTGGYTSFGAAGSLTVDRWRESVPDFGGLLAQGLGGFRDRWTVNGITGAGSVQFAFGLNGSNSDNIVSTYVNGNDCEGGGVNCTLIQTELRAEVNGTSKTYTLAGNGTITTEQFPVVFGAPFDVYIYVFAAVNWPAVFGGTYDGTGVATADWNHTAVMNGIKVFDAAGLDITNSVTLDTVSGATFPINGPGPTVPEPSTWLLIGGGLLGLQALRRLR